MLPSEQHEQKRRRMTKKRSHSSDGADDSSSSSSAISLANTVIGLLRKADQISGATKSATSSGDLLNNIVDKLSKSANGKSEVAQVKIKEETINDVTETTDDRQTGSETEETRHRYLRRCPVAQSDNVEERSLNDAKVPVPQQLQQKHQPSSAVGSNEETNAKCGKSAPTHHDPDRLAHHHRMIDLRSTAHVVLQRPPRHFSPPSAESKRGKRERHHHHHHHHHQSLSNNSEAPSGRFSQTSPSPPNGRKKCSPTDRNRHQGQQFVVGGYKTSSRAAPEKKTSNGIDERRKGDSPPAVIPTKPSTPPPTNHRPAPSRGVSSDSQWRQPRQDTTGREELIVMRSEEMSEWGVERVGEFLDGIGCGDYKEIFHRHHITGDSLPLLRLKTLTDFGLTIGHATTLMARVHRRIGTYSDILRALHTTK